MTSAVANRRMPSASDRVTRKITADSVLTARAEAPLQQLVRREQLAAEIRRDEEHADEDAADDVAERELQERHVAGIGLRRHADEVSVLVSVATIVKQIAHHGTMRSVRK